MVKCDVSFGSSVIHIKNYIAAINSKIKGYITQEDIDKYIPIIEKILNLGGEEQKISTQIVVPYLKENMGIAT